MGGREGLAAARHKAAVLALSDSMCRRSGVVTGGRLRSERGGGETRGVLATAAQALELAGLAPVRALGREAVAAATAAAEEVLELAGVVPARAPGREAVAAATAAAEEALELAGVVPARALWRLVAAFAGLSEAS